jgi:hypothetical protein
MSRQLPSHPNLEHLKKQAKELLRELQPRDPALKLADAQHAIAREYGFASWPKLKAHVESLSAAVPEQAHPLVGAWTANLSKSRRHPLNQDVQSATLRIEVDGDTVMIADVVVDAAGKAEHRHTLQADGEEHPTEYGRGYALTAKWRGSHALETVARKDGQVVGWATYQVSDDCQTLTVTGDDQVAVFERAQMMAQANEVV